MSDVEIGTQTGEPTEEVPEPETKPEVPPVIHSKTFNDPSANIVLKTSDNVLFRVEDCYLRAASGFFKDMLASSVPSSTNENPLPISEPSQDLEVMLLIITGRPHDASNKPMTWRRAADLYRMMDKYQLDGHQHWFSDMCGRYIKEQPLEALFLACNRPIIDTTLARYAIADGLSTKDGADVYQERYFLLKAFQQDRYGSSPLNRVLAPCNMKAKFGLALGFKGLLAYNLTFAELNGLARPDWQALAIQFVQNARHIDEEIHLPASESEDV